MRYDKRVTLLVKSEKHYDPKLGKFVAGGQVEKTVPCHVSPVRSELVSQLGDALKDVSLVVRIRQYVGKVDSLVLDGRSFSIVKTAQHGRMGLVFYVKEVRSHG